MTTTITDSVVNIYNCGCSPECPECPERQCIEVNFSMGLPNEVGQYVVRAPVAILPGDQLLFETANDSAIATESGSFTWIVTVTGEQQGIYVTGCGALGELSILPYVIDER